MILPLPSQGLYVITSDGLTDNALLAAVAAAIQGGAVLVQYRDKQRTLSAKRVLGRGLCELCHQLRVPLIVNDDIALAGDVGADGVHLGRDDAGISDARVALGPSAIVGMSCYNSLDLARHAQSMGASYAAFGRFHASSTKPLASHAKLETLQRAKAELSIPLAVIGGITPANGAPLVAAGAAFLCAIEGVIGQPNPEQAARAYDALFPRSQQMVKLNRPATMSAGIYP